jgi:sulfite dehydrogenase (cytochrome) subunit B
MGSAWRAGAALVLLLASPSTTGRAERLSYALPDDERELRDAPGAEAARNNCLSCHSAGYVDTQPRGLGEKFWRPVVGKMIKSYRAPISEEDKEAIIDYLSRNY